jgi:hypothetical protein
MEEEKIIATENNIKMFDVKFLISNEEKIDWEKLSSIRSFTIPEIKLFGNKIAWGIYLFNRELRQEEIDVAARYVKKDSHTFKLFSRNSLSEKFISENKNNLNWLEILENSKLSEEFIFANIEHWQEYNLDDVRSAISSNRYVNTESSDYKRLSLYLKLKD